MTGKIGRFAPSPTGRLHAGNLFAYLMAWLDARSADGRIVLRIEDLDAQRSRREFADQLMRDLERVGLTWDEGPYWQSQRTEAYREAFHMLERSGVTYPCFCTRAEANVQAAPHLGEGGIYTGACRDLDEEQRAERLCAIERKGRHPSMRLRMEDGEERIYDSFQGVQTLPTQAGAHDFTIQRADGGFAYQLAVVVDDAAEGVSSVVRGCDLLPSSLKQMRLHRLLGTPVPTYGHIPLFVAADGRRLAKRDHDASFDALMDILGSPEAVIGYIAHTAGLIDEDAPTTPADLLACYRPEALQARWRNVHAIPFALPTT